jgi:LysM repeat protein
MTYTVQTGDSLYKIAQRFNVNLENLKRANQLSNDLLSVGQVLQIPLNHIHLPQKHIVQAGESLYVIAKKYGLTVGELKNLNRLASSNLRIGQELIISSPTTVSTPQNEVTFHTVQKGDTIYAIAQQYGVTIAQLIKLNNLLSYNLILGQKLKVHESQIKENEPIEQPENVNHQVGVSDNQPLFYHTIQAGESLYSIAQKYHTTVNEIRKNNQLNSDILNIGQQLVIPTKNQNPVIEQPIEDIEPQITQPEEPNISIYNPIGVPNMQSYVEARKAFILKAVNGMDIFREGLKSAVGRNRVNRPDDLEKVQRRLVQLKMLPHTHQESPEAIQERIGGGALTSNLIPKTIEAIERFQKFFQVGYWLEHTSRASMMQSSPLTLGVVIPQDITHKVLVEYTEYSLTFTHPHDSYPVTVQFNNFPRSSHTVYYEGVSYVGISKPEIPLNVYQRLGLTDALAKALQFVSTHEGNFDALNTYDKALFSYGFIQFAGNGGGFVPLLATIKHKAPKVFDDFFKVYGIDVSYTTINNTIRNAELILINPYDKGGKYLLQGIEAEQALRTDKQLYGVFIRAGHYLPIITLQIDQAIQAYIKPALNIRNNIIAGNLNLPNTLITDYIRSSMGLALLIDLTINQWINKAGNIIRQAIEKIALRNNLKNQYDLMAIDERSVIAQVITDARERGDVLVEQRATSILKSNLEWKK